MTLEQHGFELCGPTFKQIFFSCKYYSPTWCVGIGSSGLEEPQVQRADYNIGVFSTAHRISTPNPTLFKGQLYLGTETLVSVNLKKNKQTRKEIILI